MSDLMTAYIKGPKHIVYLLIPYTLIKFYCDLTYPPYINCVIVFAHNRVEPPKDCHNVILQCYNLCL